MLISRESIREIAKTFLYVLDGKGVKISGDLEKLAGHEISIEGKKNHYLAVRGLPSKFGTRELDTSYVIKQMPVRMEGRVPLGVKINQTFRYSQIILKSEEEIGGYHRFAEDIFGNIFQSVTLDNCEWDEIRKKILLIY